MGETEFSLSFYKQVSVKVDKVIKGFELYRKRQNKKFEEYLDYLFDITQPTGNWLFSEDKEFYQKQIESSEKLKKWLLFQWFTL